MSHWKELGEDIAEEGRDLAKYLREAESDYERSEIIRGFLRRSTDSED